jgi:CDP-diacylglycerol---glycerol-3-phosphate 3-phosphatidyltransferase
MKFNIAIKLTVARIVLLPILVLVYYLPTPYAHPVAAVIGFFIGLTDYFDGYLARRLNLSTRFGAFLDPVADKLAVVTGLCLVMAEYGFLLLTLCSLVIISRELIISALREWMAELGKKAKVGVLYLGKVKTTVQLLALFFLIWSSPQGSVWPFQFGFALLVIAVILTLWSMLVYLKLALRELLQDERSFS